MKTGKINEYVTTKLKKVLSKEQVIGIEKKGCKLDEVSTDDFSDF